MNFIAERFGIQPDQLSAGQREAKQCKLVLAAVEVEETVITPLVVGEVTH